MEAFAFILNSSSPVVLTVVANYILAYLNIPSLIIAILDAITFSLTSLYFDNNALEIINYFVDFVLTADVYYQVLMISSALLGLMVFAILYYANTLSTMAIWFVLIATDVALILKWALLYFSRIEVKHIPKQAQYQQEHRNED